MYAKPKYELIRKSDLNLTPGSFAAQQTKISIPSTDPIEEILIVVDVTMGASVADWIVHGLLGILKKATLYVSPKKADGTPDSYDMVNCSGAGLLMLGEQEGLRLDRSTQMVRHQNNLNAVLTGSKLRITYRISFPHPSLIGQLRQRSLLDCQNHAADPVLTLDWAPATEMSTATADPFSAARCRIFVARRDIGRAQNDIILGSGGFFKQDIRQTSYGLAASTTGEQRFVIPSGGEYASLVIAHTRGAATKRLGDISEVLFSASSANGSETLWSLESGGSPIAKFTMADLQLFGDFTRVALQPSMPAYNAALAVTTAGVAGTPAASQLIAAQEFGGPLETGCCSQNPAVVGFDFLSNALADADDFSSLLNANFDRDSVKWELVGNVSTPATYTSAVDLIGRRFRSNVSPFKLLKAA